MSKSAVRYEIEKLIAAAGVLSATFNSEPAIKSQKMKFNTLFLEYCKIYHSCDTIGISGFLIF